MPMASTNSARSPECCLTHVLRHGGRSRARAGGRRARARYLRGSREHLVGLPDALGSQPRRQRTRRSGRGAWQYCQRGAGARPGGRTTSGSRWSAGGGRVRRISSRGEPEAGLRCCEEALALAPIAFDAAMVRAVRRIRPGQGREGRRGNRRTGPGRGVVRAVTPRPHALSVWRLAWRCLPSSGRAGEGSRSLRRASHHEP